ncbi:MAG: hypothetical protein RR992_07115, partial [Clostridiales bacterium]
IICYFTLHQGSPATQDFAEWAKSVNRQYYIFQNKCCYTKVKKDKGRLYFNLQKIPFFWLLSLHPFCTHYGKFKN